jgi:hypothetical protein
MEQTYLNGGAGLPYHLNVSADKNLLMATPGLGRYVQGRLFQTIIYDQLKIIFEGLSFSRRSIQPFKENIQLFKT